MKTCPCCGQSLPDERPLGLVLAASTARLLAIVTRAGQHGIPTDVLFDRLYADDPDGGPETGHKCLHTRIWLLNRKLLTKGKKIVAIGIMNNAGGPKGSGGRTGVGGRAGCARYVLRDVQ